VSEAFPELPTRPGAYRWYYLDVGVGEWTAVAIFMVGAQFSYRYSVGAERGEPPDRHCAVNFALYRQGVRQAWVFSEYSRVRHEGASLRIGRSCLSQVDGRVHASIDERMAPFGPRVRAELALEPLCHAGTEVALLSGESHRWQAVMPRALAQLSVPALGVDGVGHGYHDTNWGDEPLGKGLKGWVWSRSHGEEATHIEYQAWGAPQAIGVVAERNQVVLDRHPAPQSRPRRSAWGLELPPVTRARTLESSPFYARLEERKPGRHTITEVADFGRFHTPWVRWMARFRSRTEASP
jgi:carotenoid 1,2-hydratase